MGTITGIVLFIFILLCIFLIFLVLIQSGKGSSGMGGMMGGGASQTPFGSSGADVMTKITRGVALSFLTLALLLSFLYSRKEEKPPVLPDSEVIIPTPEAKPSPEKTPVPSGTNTTPPPAKTPVPPPATK
jgi:preprotein translocase subunit SecG